MEGVRIVIRSSADEYVSSLVSAISQVNPIQLDNAVEVLFGAWKQGRTVFSCGNGGSSSNSSHFACDLVMNGSPSGTRPISVVSLNDNVPLITALTNDEGWDRVYELQLRPIFRRGDVLVVFSVHGGTGSASAGAWSQNLLRAVRYAKSTNGSTIAFVGYDGGILKEMADHCVHVPVYDTAIVESVHTALFHGVVQGLRKRLEMARSEDGPNGSAS